MRFLLQQEKRFYLFALYVAMVFLWVTQEIISLRINANCLKDTQKFFDYLEVGFAFLPIFGIYLLLRDLTKGKEEISTALEAITHLKTQNRKLSDLNKSFWDTAASQFESWNFTQTEKDISLLILRGYSNQQIAAVRGKSLKTIENQTFSIYQKSGTTGKIEFIAYFISPLLPEED